MRNRVSEGRALYEDYNHGHFSRRLAEWAVGNMMAADASGKPQRLKPATMEEARAALAASGRAVADKEAYTFWYLFNMALADYPKSLPTDAARAEFAWETLRDPDGRPESVLECFTAKMCAAGVPVRWEELL